MKKEIRERYGQETAEKITKQISRTIAKLKQFPQLGVSMREQYVWDCNNYAGYA